MEAIKEDGIHDDSKSKYFLFFVGLSQKVGIVMVVMVSLWTSPLFLGGYAWDGSSKQFNVHPLLMVIGMVFLYGEGAISYRVFKTAEKIKIKILHAFLHTVAFICISVGLTAVFNNHNVNNIPNMYSIHSWCGIATVVMFGFQLVLGFSGFLWPGFSPSMRAAYLSLHKLFGSAMLVMVCVTCISGINEKLIFTGGYTIPLEPVYVMGNVLGYLIVTYILLILWILYKDEWKRPPPAEEKPFADEAIARSSYQNAGTEL